MRVFMWHAQTRSRHSLYERYCISHKTRTKSDHKKFTYFLVEEFVTTKCITSRDECPINGIMELHRLVAQDDKVILLPWTCTK